MRDFGPLTQREDERTEAFKVLARMRAPFRDIPPEDIERDVAALIEEARRGRCTAQIDHNSACSEQS